MMKFPKDWSTLRKVAIVDAPKLGGRLALDDGSIARTLRPADAEPAEAAATRLFGRPPDAMWRYANAEGETAFFVCEGWRFAHWPHARPLLTA